MRLRESVKVSTEWFGTEIKLHGNMSFLELSFIWELNLLLCFCIIFLIISSSMLIKWNEWSLIRFLFIPCLSVETVPSRYDFTVSVPRATETIIQCFFRGTKIFITKLKQEQCLKFNECAFHGTTTHKLERRRKKKGVTEILILLK